MNIGVVVVENVIIQELFINATFFQNIRSADNRGLSSKSPILNDWAL